MRLNARTVFLSLATASGLALTAASASADHHAGTDSAEANEEAVPTTNIVEAAAGLETHTTLVAAVEQAQLVETLSGEGPFTVFAPTNDAFGLIGEETVQALMADTAREQFAQILAYHVVAGAIDSETLTGEIEANGGEYVVTSVEGSPLTFTIVNGAVAVTDERGGTGYVTEADLAQTNGVIHVINNVMIPNPSAPAGAQSGM